MINFACKEFKLDEVIKCSLGLSKSDLCILKYFLKNPEIYFTSETLSKKLDFNITTIQRSVKKLHEKHVLERMQNNLEKGGYIYVYKLKGKKEFSEMILKIISKWMGRVEAELKKL
ncbi:MarR family transcriptional regulator [Candidatus Woesearchaeota archaeon]|nr:MarR family transcriptional regulator [Candidatus Woesearchaeota archaeon]